MPSRIALGENHAHLDRLLADGIRNGEAIPESTIGGKASGGIAMIRQARGREVKEVEGEKKYEQTLIDARTMQAKPIITKKNL